MKKSTLALVLALPLLLAFALSAGTTGTLYGNAKSILTFSRQLQDTILLENRSATTGTIYVLFNDTGTSATAAVSSTNCDVSLVQNEVRQVSLGQGRFPITTIGVYTTLTTPVLIRKGW